MTSDVVVTLSFPNLLARLNVIDAPADSSARVDPPYAADPFSGPRVSSVALTAVTRCESL